MKHIEVKPIRGRGERRVFLTFPWRIYKGDSLWVPPLLPEWKERIDPKRGSFFKYGSADFFIAWHGGEPVGTICAAEDCKTNAASGRRECTFGFFNFIEDYDVMKALVERAAEWAALHSLESMSGPFNLDREDSYGILVGGRTRPPALLCGHTPAYYLEFMERYGFEPARGDNLAFGLDITQETPQLRALEGMAQRVRQRNKGITIRNADLAHWEDEVDRVLILLNRSLAHLEGFRPWHREVVYNMLAPFRKIVSADLVLFAEVDGECVGWFPGIPNLNEPFQRVNGLRRPWDYLKLWWLMRQSTECLAIKSVLVLPEYWGSGVAIVLFCEMYKRARAHGYKWLDMSLTSADNPRTPVLAERFGAKEYKRYRVFRLDL